MQLPDKRFQIPVENVTDDKGYADDIGDIQYMEGMQIIAFTLSGVYKGEPFSKAYYRWHDDGTVDVPMAIGMEMDPKNGVIEGYIVETFINKTPYAYIYLDEDWKKQVGDTLTSFEGNILEVPCVKIKDTAHASSGNKNFCYASSSGIGTAVLVGSIAVDAILMIGSFGTLTQVAVGIGVVAVSYYATHQTLWPGHHSLFWHT